jgi:hypothetical protein
MTSIFIWIITKNFKYKKQLKSCSIEQLFLISRLMKFLLILPLHLLAFGILSQTPKIMHKRLGGTNENFNTSLSNANSVIRQSNFGLPPTIMVKKALIDSVIVMNDSTVIVVTSHKLVQEFHYFNYEYSEQDSALVCSDSLLVKSLEYDSTGDWKPGRDTLVNHALFSSHLSCNEILSRLNQNYGINNISRNPIIFIGFDCSTKQVNPKRNFVSLLFSYFPKKPNLYILFFGVLSMFYFIYLKRKSTSFVPTPSHLI